MIVDYIDDNSAETPLIRLRDGNKEDYAALINFLQSLIDNKINEIDVFSIKGVRRGENIENFKFVLGDTNKGINALSQDSFICRYSVSEYLVMIEKIESYTNEFNGYHWLDDFVDYGHIQLLLSYSGEW